MISLHRQAFHFGLEEYAVIMDIVTYSTENFLQSYYFNFFSYFSVFELST